MKTQTNLLLPSSIDKKTIYEQEVSYSFIKEDSLKTRIVSNLPQPINDLVFQSLPTVWDEAIPLGNGIIGALIWQKGDNLRIGIDRADLWDLRPVKEFEKSKNYSYRFVCEQIIHKKDLKPVQSLIDDRSRLDPAPTKIPAGGIEFCIKPLGEIEQVRLDVARAVCHIHWKNGVKAQFFIHAADNSGRFIFENLPSELIPLLVVPSYEESTNLDVSMPKSVRPLSSLGYKKGIILHPKKNILVYHQQAWGKVSYEIALTWNTFNSSTLEGSFCVTSKGTWYSESKKAQQLLEQSSHISYKKALQQHVAWWKNYWAQSEISIPDPLLEKQWYLEQYKFGASSRKNAPPISLQAIWTADNGQTPPWRGDFHNDLNTQLSYWPGYSSNHLEESSVFTDWLWKIKDNSKDFTHRFFGVKGLNVPCIATLTGKAIGGWSPYSHSPSTAGWLCHYFYLQWKYSMDKDFLMNRAYPFVKQTAIYFNNISVIGDNGKRKLPLSSSPEINDNRIDAWFTETTNYDLSNIRLTYTVATEMANALGERNEAARWQKLLEEWPQEASDENGLLIAPNYPLKESHRHLSHMLSFHPFGLIDVSKGDTDKALILKSIKHFEDLGPDWWIGYTYAWLANMKARVMDGDGALKNLHIFIKAFCSPNSFHLNGDQTRSGYSRFDYRPFTLEGNFACASAIQEMLMQSHTGVIKLFPALPHNWKDASFKRFRAMGAFLVSAVYQNCSVKEFTVESEKGGLLRMENPYTGELIEKEMKAGEVFRLTAPAGK
ncbi:glycosyl hydrolase family 95 catalytic domain-containing protein [Bacteroides sedimenti]|uniref:Glycosyl hydrolase family 95 N-terminal domain-containing protein n=1 Tax=Bacteroides sedimenti TaxID=2136147 RepID=A0ABN6Z0A7_9BACE